MPGSPPEADRPTRAPLWPAPLIIVAGAACYLNSLHAPFVLDDLSAIVANHDIRRLRDPLVILGGTNRPVLEATFALNYAVGKLDTFGYHLVNVAIHLAAALTLYAVVHRTVTRVCTAGTTPSRNATPLALAVALLWVVHPLQTAAVTYVVQRGESLMALFYLLTLYASIRAAEPASAHRRRGWIALAVLACALGMGTKEVMVSAPLVVMLYDRTFLYRATGEAVRRRWPLYLGLVATWTVLLYTVVWVGAAADADRSAGFGMRDVTTLEYARTQPEIILHYLRLAVWPHPLCFDPMWPVQDDPLRIALAGATVAALAVGSLFLLWRRHWIGFCGTAFFLILAPTSSVMPIRDLAFEHRMYLPLAAVLVVIVGLIASELARQIARPRVLGGAVLGVVAVGLGLLTVQRNTLYHSHVTLWRSVLVHAPHNFRAHNNLGIALRDRGDHDTAIDHYRRALRLNPQYAEAIVNLGIEHARAGDMTAAIDRFREAVRVSDGYAGAHYNLGRALRLTGRNDQALPHLAEAVRLNPRDHAARAEFGWALTAHGEHDRALEQFRTALHLDRRDLLAATGLAWVLAVHPNDQTRDPKQALHIAEQLATVTQHRSPAVLDALAAACAATGDFDRAVRTARTALALAERGDDDRLPDGLRSRLDLYRRRIPYLAPAPPRFDAHKKGDDSS